MGTHGLFGFYYQGKYYLMYNHYDSYPSSLGYSLIWQIRKAIANDTFRSWPAKVKALQVIDLNGERKPTPQEIARLAPYTNLNVSNKSTEDWYCLVRGTQGRLEEVLDAGFVFHDQMYWYFLEYIYVVNLDTQQLEIHYDSDRFSEYPLDFLPEDNIFDYEEGVEEYQAALKKWKSQQISN